MSTVTYKLSWDFSEHYDLLDCYFDAHPETPNQYFCALPVTLADIIASGTANITVKSYFPYISSSTTIWPLCNSADGTTGSIYSDCFLGLGATCSGSTQAFKFAAGTKTNAVQSFNNTPIKFATFFTSFDFSYVQYDEYTAAFSVTGKIKDDSDIQYINYQFNTEVSALPANDYFNCGCFNSRVYEVSFKLGNNATRTLVPVRRQSDSMAGLYDDATGIFYPVPGVTYGNIITPNWR